MADTTKSFGEWRKIGEEKASDSSPSPPAILTPPSSRLATNRSTCEERRDEKSNRTAARVAMATATLR
ncbi:hypothetical protein V9T40_005617 [Parthenolecanium corni]|uniref:Uncharacterized protein n=1 Tax=Parthenolecanium corni TaxID=536013 RepID=A0AAN9Y9U0_9HEMI